MLDRAVELCSSRGRAGRVMVLTGAGISAESGIPTFRGPEGYWTVGAREYQPQELATQRAFRRMPLEVWAWYLYRRGECRAAQPNAAHQALARAADVLRDRFTLVTQNVDGLHRRAGNTGAYEIHGNIDLARCSEECSPASWPLGEAVPPISKGAGVPAEVAQRLRCPRCGALARPHVLWFDESYDEERYHLDTVRALARQAAVLIVVGTSAQTNLPWQVVDLAADARALIIDVNVEHNPFADMALAAGGAAVKSSATAALPRLMEALAP